MSSFNIYDSANNRWLKIYGGQGTSCADLYLINQFIVQNEIPTRDTIDNRKLIILSPFLDESLCVYLNGRRLLNGSNNDFVIMSAREFRINDNVDYYMSDNVIIDYKRSDLF